MFGFMKIQLKEWLYNINQQKKNIMDENPLCEKGYPAWVINHALYAHSDTILLVNEMNINNHLDTRLQFDFLI